MSTPEKTARLSAWMGESLSIALGKKLSADEVLMLISAIMENRYDAVTDVLTVILISCKLNVDERSRNKKLVANNQGSES